MARAAVADHILGVAGIVGDVAAIEDAADAQDGRDGHQGMGGVGKNLKICPDDREMAELHQDTGMQHARGRGRGGMPDG